MAHGEDEIPWEF
jgi:hypothetical protein